MVPKTVLWFSDSLGQKELRIAVVILIIVYCSVGIRIKISKSKGCIGQNPGGASVGFQASAPSGAVWMVLNSAVMCDNMESIVNQGSSSEL